MKSNQYSEESQANLARIETVIMVTENTGMMICAIWYYSHNLKHVKNIHGGALLLAKLQALKGLLKSLTWFSLHINGNDIWSSATGYML